MKDVIQSVQDYSAQHSVSITQACKALKVGTTKYYYHLAKRSKASQGGVVVVDHGKASSAAPKPAKVAPGVLLRAVVLIGKPSDVLAVLREARQ